MKRVEIDGEFFRYRRGKLVKIPDEWVGQVTTPQTINKRDSKLTNKLRRQLKMKQSVKRLEFVDGRHDPILD